MAIEIDMAKPLIGLIIINVKAQKVEYEGIPSVCYKCGKVGHLKEKCLENSQEKQTETKAGENMNSSQPQVNPTSPEIVKNGTPTITAMTSASITDNNGFREWIHAPISRR